MTTKFMTNRAAVNAAANLMNQELKREDFAMNDQGNYFLGGNGGMKTDATLHTAWMQHRRFEQLREDFRVKAIQRSIFNSLFRPASEEYVELADWYASPPAEVWEIRDLLNSH